MIGHGASADGNAPGGAQAHKGMVPGGIGRQTGHVPGGGIVGLTVQAAGIFKGGILHPQLPCQAVHPPDKGCRPAAAVGQGLRRVVAGAQQQAVQQLLHRHPLSGPEVHGGTLCHVFLLYSDDVRRRGAFQRHQGRHDLGGAGDEHPPAAVLVIQHLPGVRVHQHGGRGAGGHAPHPHRRQAPPQRQPHQQPRPFSHRDHPISTAMTSFYSLSTFLFPPSSCR